MIASSTVKAKSGMRHRRAARQTFSAVRPARAYGRRPGRNARTLPSSPAQACPRGAPHIPRPSCQASVLPDTDSRRRRIRCTRRHRRPEHRQQALWPLPDNAAHMPCIELRPLRQCTCPCAIPQIRRAYGVFRPPSQRRLRRPGKPHRIASMTDGSSRSQNPSQAEGSVRNPWMDEAHSQDTSSRTAGTRHTVCGTRVHLSPQPAGRAYRALVCQAGKLAQSRHQSTCLRQPLRTLRRRPRENRAVSFPEAFAALLAVVALGDIVL